MTTDDDCNCVDLSTDFSDASRSSASTPQNSPAQTSTDVKSPSVGASVVDLSSYRARRRAREMKRTLTTVAMILAAVAVAWFITSFDAE